MVAAIVSHLIMIQLALNYFYGSTYFLAVIVVKFFLIFSVCLIVVLFSLSFLYYYLLGFVAFNLLFAHYSMYTTCFDLLNLPA